MLTAADLLLRAVSAAPDLIGAVLRIGQIWTRQGLMTETEWNDFKARCETEFASPHWRTDDQ